MKKNLLLNTFVLFAILLSLNNPTSAQWTLSYENDVWVHSDKLNYQSSSDAVYCRSTKKLYKSVDKGISWTIIYETEDIIYNRIDDYYIEGNRIWIIGHDNDIGNFLKYSADAGETWENRNIPNYPNFSIINYKEVLFRGCPHYLPGNEYGMYRSFDNGDTWEPIINTEQNQTACVGLFIYNDILFSYYGLSVGMYWSDDYGDNWHPCNNGSTYPPEPTPYIYRISITPLGLTIIYTDQFTGMEMVYSEDGINWSRTNSFNFTPYTLTGNSEKWFSLDPNSIVSKAIFSMDEGNTWIDWSESEVPFLSIDQLYLYKDVLLASNSGQIFRRPIGEAVTPPPPTPTEIESSGGYDLLVEFYGTGSSNGIPDNIIDDFLENYEDSGAWDSPIEGMQPGTCSVMGMPVWKVNSASNQLYIEDVISTTAALGPDPTIDMHYNKNLPFHYSTLNNSWALGFDMELDVSDNNVFIVSGKFGKKTFENNYTTKSNVWKENEYSQDSISFDGNKWHYSKKNERLIYNFSSVDENIYLLESITDFDDNTLQITRNQFNKISKITDVSGRDIVFSYNGENCTGFSLLDGRNASFTYTVNGFLTEVVDFAGNIIKYTYDADNELIKIDINDKITSFTYNYIHGFNRVATTNTYSDQEIFYEFYPKNTSTNVSKVSANGIVKYYTSKSGKTISVKEDYGISSSRTINESGLLTSFKGAGGLEYAINYDVNTNPEELFCNDKTETTLTWDSNKNIISKTNALGNTWYYDYDSFNRLIKITSPENRQTTLEYYNNGLLKKSINDNIVTSYVYDAYGNVKEVTNSNGGVTKYDYSDYGYQLLSITSPEGRKTSFTYDENNKLIKTAYDDGNFVERVYDCCSQVGKIDENGNENWLTRTTSGSISQFVDGEGNETNWEYNDRKQPTSIENALGNITYYTYNEDNFVNTIIDPEMGELRYLYNNQNKLIRIINQNNRETKFLRDLKGDLIGIIYPNDITNSDTVKYARNEIGQITSITNLRGQSINMTYDKDGNALTRSINGDVNHFNWDNTAHLTSYSNNSASTSYERNNAGVVTKITYPNDLEVQFEYDLDGNMIQISYPKGFAVHNTINNRGRINNILWDAKNISLTYDGVGNLLEEKRDNTSKSTYTYYKNNKLKTISHFEYDTLFSEYIFTRDAVGNITNINILPVKLPSKVPDTWYEYFFRNDNQLHSNMKAEMGTQAYYSYDADGNCISAYGTVSFFASYTDLNQLSKFKLGDDSITLDYDAMGNLVHSDLNGDSRLYYYDHKGRLLFETDINGNNERYYIYKAKRIMAFVEDGLTYYIQYDQSGNTIYIRDENNNIVNRYIYSSFGEILGKDEQIPYHFTYNGAFGVYNIMDGYYLMRTRLYQACNARFLQRDPLNLYGDVNGYRFVGNNPYSGTDPYGMEDNGNSTLNSSSFDGGYDNDGEVSGGTPDIYDYNLTYEQNTSKDPTYIISENYKKVSDSPAGDFLPDILAIPNSISKAKEKFDNGDGIFAIGWQFVPFNNSMEYFYNAKKKEMEQRNWDYYHMPDGREKLIDPDKSCSWW